MRNLISILFTLLVAAGAIASPPPLPFGSVMVDSNGIVVRPNYFWSSNANEIYLAISNDILANYAINNLLNQSTNLAANLDGFTMQPAVQGGTNLYWFDFGQTNSVGQNLIYGTLAATNDVEFIGVTNCVKWSELSFNVVASGGDRNVRLPDNLPHLDTNGLALVNGALQLTLTNGNEFRMTIQSNSTLSTLWTTFGQ